MQREYIILEKISDWNGYESRSSSWTKRQWSVWGCRVRVGGIEGMVKYDKAQWVMSNATSDTESEEVAGLMLKVGERRGYKSTFIYIYKKKVHYWFPIKTNGKIPHESSKEKEETKLRRTTLIRTPAKNPRVLSPRGKRNILSTFVNFCHYLR